MLCTRTWEYFSEEIIKGNYYLRYGVVALNNKNLNVTSVSSSKMKCSVRGDIDITDIRKMSQMLVRSRERRSLLKKVEMRFAYKRTMSVK